jgi:hypothetical protein
MEGDHLEDEGMDGVIILNKSQIVYIKGYCEVDSCGSRKGKVTGCSDHGNKHSVFIKSGQFF